MFEIWLMKDIFWFFPENLEATRLEKTLGVEISENIERKKKTHQEI